MIGKPSGETSNHWKIAPALFLFALLPAAYAAADVSVAELDRSRILAAADAALRQPPISITHHRAPLSEGGPHDFFSMSDYYWPDPEKPDGKPFVVRDGQSYTGLFNDHRQAVMGLRDAVAALAAAYRTTGGERYAAKAAELLRVFFVDPETRMNPNLEHAQVIVGKPTPGRGIGIIDTLHLAEVAVAIRALEGNKAFTPELMAGLRGWFREYLVWLRDSARGKSEARMTNNHAVAFWLQVAAFCQVAPDEALLAECRRQFKEIFVAVQMAPDGSFPLELKRTKPYAYSIFQLDNLASLCQLLSTPKDNLWTFELPDGRGMRKAMAYLYPFLADKSSWPLQPDVMAWEAWPVRQSGLLFGGLALGEQKYVALWKRLKPDPADFEIRRNNAVTQPLLWLSPPPPPAPRGTGRVNILFLMDDQHRGDWIGAAGASWIITPNLDRLAREGVLYRRGYSSTPSCKPARHALLTGMSPWGHGNLGFGTIPEQLAVEKPRLFTAAGYRTHAVGKNHFAPQRATHGYQSVVLGEPKHANGKAMTPFDDFEEWFAGQLPGRNPYQEFSSGNDQRGGIHYAYDEKFHETRWTADRAISFLETHPRGQPWFLKVSWVRPHAPWNAPKRWHDRYEGVAIPQAQVGDWARALYGGRSGTFAQDPDITRGVVPEEEIRESRRSYAAAVSFVDEQIGRVLEALEKRGELENTLVLVTSDHGDIMGDNLLYRKTYAVEGSVNVPMIVRWPASLGLPAPRGQVRQELVELRDVLPTFLDAAGLPVPAAVEGKSLLDPLRGRPWRDVLDLEHASCYAPEDGWVALMGPRYKYVYYTITGAQQLFDLQEDPHELRDLAADPASAALVKEWRQRMVEHLSTRGEDWVRNGDLVVQPKAIQWRPGFGPDVKRKPAAPRTETASAPLEHVS